MRDEFVIDNSGARSKSARYRETLQTTGFNVDRIVIVPGEFAPMFEALLSNHRRLNSNGHRNAFLEAWRNLSVRCGVGVNPNPGRSIASRQLAPDPSLRTRREERALLIVPMSSGRLFLDRVARQHGPSPLHRHDQDNSIAGSNGTNYHRTVTSVLTTCLTPGGRRISAYQDVSPRD